MPVVTITEPAAYKCGSTWEFVLTRKDSVGTPIDLTGLTVRAMFRATDPNGAVITTLTEADGITVDATAGQVTLTLPPSKTVLFTGILKVVFDVEMTKGDDAWQSSTYRFKTEPEVTRNG